MAPLAIIGLSYNCMIHLSGGKGKWDFESLSRRPPTFLANDRPYRSSSPVLALYSLHSLTMPQENLLILHEAANLAKAAALKCWAVQMSQESFYLRHYSVRPPCAFLAITCRWWNRFSDSMVADTTRSPHQ